MGEYTWLIVGGVVVVVLLWGVSIYNGLIRLLNLTKEGWSGIEVQLKRRSDLIPNLVETVKGYAQHESGTFEAITKARAAATAATTPEDRAKAEGQVSSLIGRIVAISEAYPELKANQNFLALQQELSNVEEQINLSRRYYNGAVRNYNTAIQTFPSNILAGLTRFVAAEFFEIEDPADRVAPKVSFGR
jgi:LemA protein